MKIRQFAPAAKLFLDALATFTSTELMDYKSFVKYTVITSMLTLNRPEFKKRVRSLNLIRLMLRLSGSHF